MSKVKRMKINTKQFVMLMTMPKTLYMIQTYHIPVILIAKENMLNIDIKVCPIDDVRARIEPEFIKIIEEGRSAKLDFVISSDTKGKKKILIRLEWNDAFDNKYDFEKILKLSFKI